MLWIYDCDPNAPEHQSVRAWLEGERRRPGIIETEEILVNTLIIIEIVHNLRRVAGQAPRLVYDYISRIMTLRNMKVEEFDRNLLIESMRSFEDYYRYGIGGRDATILAAMRKNDVTRIATHDSKILAITDFERIDPAVKPPFVLRRGQAFKRK